MIDIKNIEGKLFQHIPTGEIRKVVYADDDCVTLCDKSRYSTCYTVDFLKFWKPYEEDDKVLKNIKAGQLYKHTPTGIVKRVVLADNNRVTFKEDSTSYYSHCSIKDFKKFWIPYEVPNVKALDDEVNHPSHYTWLKDLCGIEVIDITRHMDFNLGNSIKYILRSGHKKEEGYTDKQKTVEDLKKAVWYIEDEIKMLENKE